MIAVIASWPALAASAAAAPTSAPTPRPRIAAAPQIEALIRKNSGNVEIVTFANRHLPPVRVVRGRREPRLAPAMHGATQIVSFAGVGEPPSIVTVLRGASAPGADPFAIARTAGIGQFAAAPSLDLDRVSFAVDGAESSHGTDPAMWRRHFAGPQGPMQVSAAAAIDAGGGDRFNLAQNRELGRAYLETLYRRYGNWPDAITAYNWGPGNMDKWIGGGRPALGLPLGVERYRDRVLRDGGVEENSAALLMPLDRRFQTP